ncbi:hypothetical protein KW787_02535 [Candidatus Pacearchaeota archaeon]|nr:hypothetical protein [Candidatus Pacearchaeota archaeon]
MRHPHIRVDNSDLYEHEPSQDHSQYILHNKNFVREYHPPMKEEEPRSYREEAD